MHEALYADRTLREIPISSVNYVVPDGIAVIGDHAGADCFALESVVIPEGVKHIGLGAFEGCARLMSVSLPQTLTSIDARAFEGCASLETVSLPDGVEFIRDSVFFGCESLMEIKLPARLKSIENHAFDGCASLKGADMPPGLLSIGESAFAGCSSITRTELPSGVAIIGSGAFDGCLSLERLTLTLRGSETTIELPGEKDAFVFYFDRRTDSVIIRYDSNGELVLRMIDSNAGEGKTFTGDMKRCDENYGKYVKDPDYIKILFQWISVRDAKPFRAEIPPSWYIMDAMGKKTHRYYYYKKRFFNWNKENNLFRQLSVAAQAKIFALLVMLGGFDKDDSIACEALAIIDGILINRAASAIIESLPPPPSDCVPQEDARTFAEKIALFKSLAASDAGFFRVVFRYLNDFKRIKKLALKQGVAVGDIDLSFIDKFIESHNLFIRNAQLRTAASAYRGDMDQTQAQFLDDLSDKAAEIERAHGERSKAFVGGVSGRRADGYEFVWPKITDARTLVLGFATGSCFRPPGRPPSERNETKGVSVLGEAVVSYDVAPLIILDENEIAAFAIVNYNAEEGGLLVDNVEVVPEYLNPESNLKILMTIKDALASMKIAMNGAGRPVRAINIRYDKSNDLLNQIGALLPESAAPLRVRNYSYGDCPVYSNERGRQWSLEG